MATAEGYGRAWAVALLGLRGILVDVEAHIVPGLSRFALVGLPDSVLCESRDRVRAAIANSGFSWPQAAITVSLSPAWVRKSGAGFDLAISAALLRAMSQIRVGAWPQAVFMAELSLDGRVRPVHGVLPSTVAAASAGHDLIFCAQANAVEARQVPGPEVAGIRSLRQMAAYLNQTSMPGEPDPEAGSRVPAETMTAGPDHDPRWADGPDGAPAPDLTQVLGQYEARRALEISAAGGHHVFFCGPPGSGKTMLAERLPGLLPALDTEAALEVSSVHSLAGTLPPGRPLITRPPFCAVHHSVTVAAMIGGGSGELRPGAVSRAHRGVLFLDEAPELGRAVLESLREPIESGVVEIARSIGTVRFPAQFQLVMAANPCPCGRAGEFVPPPGTELAEADASEAEYDPRRFARAGLHCVCRPRVRIAYLSKLSGPLIDRIDLRVDVAPAGPADLLSAAAGGPVGESTAQVSARVAQARDRAARRLAGSTWRCNAQVPGQVLRSRWPMETDALATVEQALRTGALTARGLDRVIRVAWTIADLEGRDRIDRYAVDSALGFRLGFAGTNSP
ncbi:MAG TPA: ATP-binding protein [Actinocrinis sp.]|nr:ATP-binding protein [Actinocrinis sp.]